MTLSRAQVCALRKALEAASKENARLRTAEADQVTRSARSARSALHPAPYTLHPAP